MNVRRKSDVGQVYFAFCDDDDDDNDDNNNNI